MAKRYREVYLENAKTLADSGTEIIELAVTDPISEIAVKVYADNGATSNKDAPIPLIVSKIEVVDGANVIYSLDGEIAFAAGYYMQKKLPMLGIREAEGYVQHAEFIIGFGRWLWDPIFALVPQKFRNLQLKLTWNLAAVRAVGATGFVTNTGKVTVVVRVIEGLETEPTGYMMTKNHYNFTSAASGEERIPLPTDYPYAMLLYRAYEAGINMSTSISNAKLNIDFDKVVPFDYAANDIRNRIAKAYDMCRIHNIGKGDDAEAHESWLADTFSIQMLANASAVILGLSSTDAARYTVNQKDHANVAANGVTRFVECMGIGPFNVFAIPFGILDDPDTYLPAPEHGDIKLVLTQGNAGAVVDVALVQLRSYK